ncbi:hypothetical protein MTBUT4_620014 [Magnetospirillum sp. UT-4]|nr:hypothetical protein MTBUT4_620014 [Magnetospirillum sp. UT-4]
MRNDAFARRNSQELSTDQVETVPLSTALTAASNGGSLGRIREWERIETRGAEQSVRPAGLGRIREWERIETSAQGCTPSATAPRPHPRMGAD